MLLSLTQWLYDTTFILNILIFLIIIARKPTHYFLGAKWSYALWLVLVIKLLLPPLPSFSKLISSSKLDAYLANAMPSMANLKLAVTDPTLGKIVIAIWLIGALSFASYLIITQQRFKSKLKNNRVPTTDLQPILLSLAKAIKLKAIPNIIATTNIESPTTIGLLSPKILIPHQFTSNYSNAEQIILLQHELMHIKRKDLIFNFLAQIIRCCFWFNPFIHLAHHLYRLDQECACDEATILNNQIENRDLYSATLIKTVTKQNHVAPSSTCLWYSLKQLNDRAKALNAYRKIKGDAITGPILLMVVCASTLVIAAPIINVSNQVFKPAVVTQMAIAMPVKPMTTPVTHPINRQNNTNWSNSHTYYAQNRLANAPYYYPGYRYRNDYAPRDFYHSGRYYSGNNYVPRADRYRY